jgi:hypothetical protein
MKIDRARFARVVLASLSCDVLQQSGLAPINLPLIKPVEEDAWRYLSVISYVTGQQYTAMLT